MSQLNRYDDMTRNLVLFLFLIFLFACSKPDATLRSFYFPSEHKIYVYTANDSVGAEYWEVIPTDDGLLFNVYNGLFQLSQKSTEVYYDNGVNLEKLILGSEETEIVSGFTFPFEKLDSSEVLFYHIKWQVPEENKTTTYELLRNRRFVGMSSYKVLDDSKNCASFKLDERIISDQDGTIEMKTSGIEYYAENIGLVYRRRQVTESLLLEQKLIDILSPEEFKAVRRE